MRLRHDFPRRRVFGGSANARRSLLNFVHCTVSLKTVDCTPENFYDSREKHSPESEHEASVLVESGEEREQRSEEDDGAYEVEKEIEVRVGHARGKKALILKLSYNCGPESPP